MYKVLVGMLAASLLGGAVWAQEVQTPEPEIERTIQQQMDALSGDDFAAAFDYAAPVIQDMFQTPENFGTMVERGYPMVRRNNAVRFGQLHQHEGALWQRVIITDENGVLHTLDYRMEQIDGAWRIAGVQFARAPAVSA